jgi:hypothetical protein
MEMLDGIVSVATLSGATGSRRKSLEDEYREVIVAESGVRAQRRSVWLSLRAVHQLIPADARLRLADASFRSPGFLGFFAARSAANVVATTLEYRREAAILKAGGLAAEVQGRQAEADMLKAEARMADADANTHDARARAAAARYAVEESESKLRAALISQLTQAMDAGVPPELLAATLAEAHRALLALDDLYENGTLTSIRVHEQTLGAGETPSS